MGYSNPLFIGGRSPSGAIAWGAYPDNNVASGDFRYYFTGNSVAKIQFDGWSGNLLFDFNDPTQARTQYDQVNWKTRMSLTADGALALWDANGVGQFKVDNTGQLWARKVTVTLSPIPDYVFGDHYKLLPLAKVENFIKKYRHLPNIKSAKEYENEQRIDVGEMQLKLLEKVEELTLYVIQQQKEIEKLNAKLAKLN